MFSHGLTAGCDGLLESAAMSSLWSVGRRWFVAAEARLGDIYGFFGGNPTWVEIYKVGQICCWVGGGHWACWVAREEDAKRCRTSSGE